MMGDTQTEPQIVIAASDPLNLVGTLLPGEKLSRQLGARLLLRDGVPVARKVGAT